LSLLVAEVLVIDCISVENCHLFGDALASQYRLRYRVFIERQAWDVPSWNGMEYDRYDTPAAHYLVWRDQEGEVRGVSRLSPTSRPYMLKECWPHMVGKIPLPESDAVWEGTRFGIDRDLAPELRRQIACELVCAYAEFGLLAGISQFIGVMPTLIWRAVFINSGWMPEFLGDPCILGGDKVVAGRIFVSNEALARVRHKTRIEGPVLRIGLERPLQRTAA
jgi:N-acyl-L-homoserine lactone synthetase